MSTKVNALRGLFTSPSLLFRRRDTSPLQGQEGWLMLSLLDKLGESES
jgi:hypothetical protein